MLVVKKVAIPSTSGQWFLREILNNIFHSLHSRVAIPSTSGQWFLQHCCSNKDKTDLEVAIPSTSGQWFLPGRILQSFLVMRSRNPFYIRSMIPTAFWLHRGQRSKISKSQSLLHQVNDSYNTNIASEVIPYLFSRNPFYIRSMIPTYFIVCNKRWGFCKVAIPSTSGQWFLLDNWL